MIKALPEEVERAVRANPGIAAVIENWDDVALPDCWIVAGAIVQSYWNATHDLPPLHGIDDIDLVYFDASDLSEASESQHASRIDAMLRDVGVKFDVKNEARVHLWYEERFGYPIEPYASSRDAIDTFPTTAGAIGVCPMRDAIECYASFGFDDLLQLVVRPNKRQVTREIYDKKVARWRKLWPKLDIVDWDAT